MPFDVQTGELEYGASADTGDATVTAVPSIGAGGQAFARLTTTMFFSAGPAAGTTTARYPDDMGCGCTMSSTTNVRGTRYSTGENVDYHNRFEVLVLPSTGPNAGIVRFDGDITMSAGASGKNTLIGSISNMNDCVAHVVGVRHEATSAVYLDRTIPTAKMGDFGGDAVRLERGDGGNELIVSVVVTELTGSAWGVEQIDISHPDAGDLATTIADVGNWANAFIVGSMRNNSGYVDRSCFVIRPGSTTTSVRTYLQDGTSTNDFTLYICKNANVSVNHINSITGSEADHPASGGQPQVINTTIAAVSDLAKTSVIASATTAGATGALNACCFAYQPTSPTNLRWERSEDENIYQWAAQIIELPADNICTPGVMMSAG